MNRERADTRSLSVAWGRLLYRILFASIIAIGLYGGYLAYTRVRVFAAQTPFKTIPPILRSASPSQQSIEQARPPDSPELTVQEQVKPAPVNTIYPSIENKEPINVLFMGIDQRAGENTTCRTDTMILASINPQDKSVSLLSIPRDLWVRIPLPKHEFDKITTAHYWGEVENYPGGGPALAMQTVHNTIGIRPHYYVRLNFTGFENMIDRIGGVDVNVPETIDDDHYPNENYGYEHLYIPAGQHHFDGEMALKYARTRYGSDDFTRMNRQQQLILAVRNQVLDLDNLSQLIAQLPQLYRDLGDSLETDIPVDLMITMAEWALDIDGENIHTASIDRRMTKDWMTTEGVQVLVYEREKARPLINDLFRLSTPEAVPVETTQVEKLEIESARVTVYNGTITAGLAGRVSTFLGKQGLEVSEPQNATSSDYKHTILNVYNDKPFTVDWLVNMFGISSENIIYHQQSQIDRDVDIAIVIGQDFPAEQYK
ncbi:MAG: LCP family protein [Anaerolineae bacterium]|nr:LCP family protein [Anaerolineae bacterium]